MENGKQKTIKSFRDLNIYQRLYGLMLLVHKNIIPQLPREERYDLADQLRRSSKAAPALVAEGFSKRYQVRQWRKYLDDAVGEANETIHHLSVVKDIYSQYVGIIECEKLIDEHEIANKQTYCLKKSWQDFHENNKN